MNHTTLNDSRPMRILFAIGMMLFTIAHHCHAQILISDVFSGTNPGVTSISATSALLSGATTSATVGPGFAGTVTLGSGVVYTDTLTINPTATPGSLTLSGNGVVGAAGTFDASKTFTGDDLAASTTYTFTLTKSSASSVLVMSTLNFTITQGGATVANTSTGTGLAGGTAVNMLSLFGSGNTATFTFTTPSTLNTTVPLVFDVNGGTAVSLLNSSIEFTDGTIQAVPEPSTWAMLLTGLLAVGMICRVRSLRPAVARATR